MRIDVSDIPVKGRHLRLSGAVEHDLAVVGAAVDGTVTELTGLLKVTREKRGLRAEVSGEAVVHRACDRCLADVTYTVSVDQELVYRPASEAPVVSDLELAPEDLDAGFFDGLGIETDDVLSEAFALAAPPRVTCAGDVCEGTVPLGPGSEDDPAPTGHPAFAKLKNLKL